MRLSCIRHPVATNFLLGSFLFAGCTVTPPLPAAESATENAAQTGVSRATGASAQQFLGAPVSLLDRALGTPALVRREGPGEFRRYDLGACRVYAVVDPAGLVNALSTGPSTIGAPALPFEQCTGAR